MLEDRHLLYVGLLNGNKRDRKRNCSQIIHSYRKCPKEIFHMFEWNKNTNYILLCNNYSSDIKKHHNAEYMHLKIYT